MTKQQRVKVPKEEEVPLHIIAGAVASHYGIQEDDMFERTRKREFVSMRFQFFRLNVHFNQNRNTLATVGKYCDKAHGIKKYDHATVLHGIRTSDDLLQTDAEFRDNYDKIKYTLTMWSLVNKEQNKKLKEVKSDILIDVGRATSVQEIRDILKSL